jgi:serine/threonine protein kinase/tetratricopeptide (TPR) repeat protein
LYQLAQTTTFPAVADENPESLTDLRSTLETTLGDTYVFERELGGGGMSRVFLAEDRTLERRVVVKVLQQDVAAGVSFDRFRREIQLAAKLQHPHIVPLLSSGEIAGIPYFTMPFIEGESLRARLAREGELPVTEAVRVLRHVAAALSYAHKHGVVHRDIKPDNVMLAEDFALVTDFGVSKALSASSDSAGAPGLTTRGLALGTPAYMAPEQAVADPGVDHRADIYSWGVMAYEMLTGWPPFSGLSQQATLAAQAVEQPEPIQKKRPGLPPALSNLVMRCLEKRPADRPQTAAELLHELDAIATSTSGIPATSVSPAAPAPVRTAVIAGAAIVLLAAIGFLYKGGTFRSSSGSTGELSSVAVLPLENVGHDTANDYFSDGMTDELANALGKLPGLRVASRTSAYAFKGRNVDVADIGRALHVQALLEGTVRRAGNRLRVTAQLTSVSDGLSLWSDTYERDAKDVFQVQDDIARSIADALKLKLGAGAATVASTSRGTENLKAYDYYLRGMYFWYRRGADNLKRAVSYFDQAVATDSGFGRAHAALASSYALLPEYTDSPPPDALERTRAAASRALAIDTGLAAAHTALGLASVHAWDWENAEKEYRMAIALEPRYATAHQWYGELLYHTGRVDAAIAQIRQATELDPLAPVTASALGYALELASRCDEGISEAKKGIELAPGLSLTHLMLAYCYLQKRDYPDAIRSMETAARLEPNHALEQGNLGYIYGATGKKEQARAVLAGLKERARSQHVSPFAIALAELGVGDTDAALTAFEQAVDEHDIGISQFSVVLDKTWDPVRANPRFKRILERLNLARYAENARKR